jgi:uncharacterized protein
MRLSPPVTRSVRVRRNIGVRARDGAVLRTDHYAPQLESAPTVLIRTPYGRTGLAGVAARTVAERGFHVVISACRGTGGSSGVFDPMRHERDDGLDTVDWLRRQPWFTGRLGTFGPSYVGYTQWAIADVPELRAMATAVTATQFRDPMYAGESFSLFTSLAWASLIQAQTGPWFSNTVELLRGQPRLQRALSHLPLLEADLVATGAEVAFFRRWVTLAGAAGSVKADAPTDDYWTALRHDHRIGDVSAAVHMVGGWHDIFLPWQIRDYAALRAAGARPYLTIGPWTHGSRGLTGTAFREGIAWLRAHLRGEVDGLRERPVRLFVSGDGGWREYDDWPPPGGAPPQRWFLGAGGTLTRDEPEPGEASAFTYDPADPTPSVGGPVLVANVAGARDNRDLEARPDVLVFSSAPLARDLEVIGPVSATVHVRASRPYLDVFVRLCDVDPAGRSVNICDGLVRVTPGRPGAAEDGTLAVPVEMWPTAHRFRAGHRIRVQVSGGAHPRSARNTGTGDPLATAVALQPVRIQVCHDAEHPTNVRLPVSQR